MPRPSRSLFASLPWDLKKTIRTKAEELEELVNTDDIDVKAELIRGVADDLLPTQPSSPQLLPADEEEEAMNLKPPSAPATVEPSPATPRPPISEPVVSPVTPAGSSKRPHVEVRESSTPTSLIQPARKRKRKSKAAGGVHADHPWDCTGLVPRYTDASQVPDRIRKYFHQRHALFPLYDSLPLLMDDTGWFSVTPHAIAEHIALRCQSDVIIDAFCGVGGNAIEFAKTCERVIAIDNNPVRLRLARHNALHSGVAERIEFVLADFTDWARAWTASGAKREAVDVVFLSPPWGGPEYLALESYPLTQIEPIPGDQLFQLTANITPNIAYFLPRNVDVKELAELARGLGAPEDDGTGGVQRNREWVEIEEEWVGDKLKAVTAYYGGLVSE